MVRRNRKAIGVALLLGFLGLAALPAQGPTAPVEVRVPYPPTPLVGSDGLTHLGYEVHITNFYASTGPLQLDRVEVFDDAAADPLVVYEGDQLADVLVHPRAEVRSGEARSIAGGRRVVLYVWMTLRTGIPVPTALRHRLLFSTDDRLEETVDGVPVAVRSPGPPVFGAPFRDGIWLAHNGPGNHRVGHWRDLLASNGRVTIPERFAIDFMGLDAGGTAVHGSPKGSSNEDWSGYGRDVLAIADGTVVEMQDGQPDHPPLAPVSLTPATLQASGGNFVLIETVGGLFVFYAHLQEGTVSVRRGDRVRRGQALGRVGNSGSSNAPHLHLHVMDAPTLTESEGHPFVFESFETLGTMTVEHAMGLENSSPLSFSPARRQRALPLDDAVIRFP